MLFTIDKHKSLSLLQIAVALFIVLAPSLIGALEIKTAIYACFVILTALVALRIKTIEKVYTNAYNLLIAGVFVYTLISSLWVNNKEGQLVYAFGLGCVLCLLTLLIDYFSEGTSENIQRRIMYMLCAGAVICALLNILYWIFYIIPFGTKEKLSLGLGSSDFLAIFMMLSLVATLNLIKGNSQGRKRLLSVAIVPILFVFILAQSLTAYIFAAILLILFFIRRNFKKAFFISGYICALIYTAFLIFFLCVSENGEVVKDVLHFASKNLGGAGGGFWSAKAKFATSIYSEKASVGMMPFLFASSGVLGLFLAVVFVARSALTFKKLKTWESLVSFYLTITIMMLPFGMNISMIFLWLGLVAYNECAIGNKIKVDLKKQTARKKVYILSILMVVATLLLAQNFIRINAGKKFKMNDYGAASKLYEAAYLINPADSESRLMYARAMRLSKSDSNPDIAVVSIDGAIKRDSDNVDNIVEKALIYYEAGLYNEAAEQYRIASSYAIVNDEYNIALSKVLREIILISPVGSSETKRAYEEIMQISQATENLDARKQINDIADEVQAYTKGELAVEE